MIDYSIESLMLEGFKDDQILENRLEAIPQDQIENSLLDDLASDKPAPGGGSAAAFCGAMAASLVSMVARLTIGKEKYKQVEAQMQEVLLQSEKHREELTELVKEDADAFNYVLNAFKLPKDSKDAGRNTIKGN